MTKDEAYNQVVEIAESYSPRLDDLWDILDELWNTAYSGGHTDGYDEGFDVGYDEGGYDTTQEM